jgi:hypothetical protein
MNSRQFLSFMSGWIPDTPVPLVGLSSTLPERTGGVL